MLTKHRLFLCFLFLVFAPLTQAQNNIQLTIEGKVIGVHDGDTVKVVDKDQKKFSIRLQGIDAPELAQVYGSESQQNLSRLVMGKQVTIVWTKLDRYGRTVGTIMLDGRDINIEQVKAGLAWHFKKYEDEQKPEDRLTYARAEETARAARLGLWKDPQPTAPGDFRAGVKSKRWGLPPPEGTVIGNKNSKKYHRPDCPGYRDMAERNRVFFKSVDEAEAAGYKRAGNCPLWDEVASRQAAKPIPTPVATTDDDDEEDAGAAKHPKLEAAPRLTPDNRPLPHGKSQTSSTDTANSQQPIIGNKNSKIYHKPDCPGYKTISEKNQVKFQSAAEAEAAGFMLAKNCKQ